MKRTIQYVAIMVIAASSFTACEKDDTDFSQYTSNISSNTDSDTGSSDISTIYIAYSGSSVNVTGDDRGYVTTNGADVTVNTSVDTDSLLLILSGSTSDGSLLICREKKFGIKLNGVSITNLDGPAINNQCGKSLYLEVAGGTTNTLSDGTAYAEQTYQQKGALFSEGQIYLTGTGTLNVTGNCKHAIACDDYIVITENVTLNANSSTGNGIKVNDGLWINDGTLDIKVTADAARGIKCDSVVVITGGTTTISTSGNCVYDSDEADYSSAACIKCDYDFSMSGGTLTMTSSGDGGKGINCDTQVLFSGGTLKAVTTGSNEDAKPKAVKGDTGIIISGGSFTATVNKSWACDNGSDSDTAADHVTIKGTPTSQSITKKSVIIKY